MAAKRNIQNIVGGPLSSDITDQLTLRLQALGESGTRTHENLLYLSSKNCWIKMTSFSELVGTDTPKLVENLLGNEVAVTSTTSLSKDWVLSGGSLLNTHTDNDPNSNALSSGLRSGIGRYTGAYGAGGINELGYRPMPGIQSLQIESLPPYGAVYSATIKIKAWNLNQLSILDMLYFRLGFRCLVEWGHSVYIDKNGIVKTDIIETINTRNPSISTESIQEDIKRLRRESGQNYEAMIGLVSNYDWTQNRDGSYDCTVKLTGLGSLAESLKINNQDNMPTTGVTSNSSDTSSDGTDTNQTTQVVVDSALKAFLAGILNFSKANIVPPPHTAPNQRVNYSTAGTPNIPAFQEYMKKVFESSTTNPNIYISQLDTLTDKNTTPGSDLDLFSHGYSQAYVKASTADKPNIGVRRLVLNDFVNYLTATVLDTNSATGKPIDINTTQQCKTYIPLSLLLAYINICCIKPESGLHIDFHPDTSLCLRLPAQVSIDPGICYIDIDPNSSVFSEMFTSKNIDPTKFTNPLSIASATGNDINTAITNVKLPTYVNTVQGDYKGNIMNVYINVEYLIQIYDDQIRSDQHNNIYLIKYVDEVLKGVQGAIGNINVLSLLPNPDSTCNILAVYDKQVTWIKEAPAIPTIPVFGLNNATVREFSLKTEASTQYGSALAITANAGNTPSRTLASSGTNIDVSSLSSINQRLRDRLAPVPTVQSAAGTERVAPASIKVPSILPSTGTQNLTSGTFTGLEDLTANLKYQQAQAAIQDQLQTLGNSINKYISYAYGFNNCGFTGPARYSPTDTPNVSNFYTDALLQTKNSSPVADTVTANGILPLALNMTLDGISGVPLFEAFTIPSNRLPVQYLDTRTYTAASMKDPGLVTPLIGFTVTGVNHTIEGNQWTTQIRGSMINLPSGSRVAPPPRLNAPNVSAPTTVNPSQVIQSTYIPALNKALPSISKGAKLLLSAQAQNEGFFPGSKSYRTNNPGNVGNTGTGTKTFPTLEAGIQAQWNKVLKGAFNGTSQYYKPTDTLLQYLSNYAPVSDGNNPPQYANFVVGYFKKQGVTITPNTTLAEINKIV